MKNDKVSELRQRFWAKVGLKEQEVLKELLDDLSMTEPERQAAEKTATQLVELLRSDNTPGLIEEFLAQYGLSTDEGVALMCLAEALLRVPDGATIDDLIEDKLISSSWGEHLGKSSSSLINAATWGLLLTGKVLDDTQRNSVARTVRGVIKRLGEPIVRKAVKRSMKILGQQFVLGESIEAAMERGKKYTEQGYTYSFDMLGEAALTANDADSYFHSYADAIEYLSQHGSSTGDTLDRPGISIKLSALHPRYEMPQIQRVKDELVPRVLELAQAAKRGNISLTIDAEEAHRLDLSLHVIERVFEHPSLDGWEGFGVVVQAYNRRAADVLDWLIALAQKYQKRIMVRLVKGAYWDTEIKRAQVDGVEEFPVFTDKAATDVSYLCCARKLLFAGKLLYPQFATHNAHTMAAVLAISKPESEYEFQRLHGMGERAFELLREQFSVRSRIYAPVGIHQDLLAYLVRRLLENGANSSFVNKVVDLSVPVKQVVADPFSDFGPKLDALPDSPVTSRISSEIVAPADLFQPERQNSRGWDLYDTNNLQYFETARHTYRVTRWRATPLIVESFDGDKVCQIINPADRNDTVGEVIEASAADVANAITSATPWDVASLQQRAETLTKAATLLEENSGELFAILTREAGKTPSDAIAEVREAVDFLRYYAAQSKMHNTCTRRGVFVCISPWNFPLAIFVGQIAAALGAGNAVLAKPAESTPLVACFATKLLYKAGVPRAALQLLTGEGNSVGAMLVSSSKVNGVCFTGSTNTGVIINRSMAESMSADAPLIAETGGLNAMIVDSTALPEQVVVDVVRSAYQSAGQRCSALRLLYIQEDIYEDVLEMLIGAISELAIGDPWLTSTDIGPLISSAAQKSVQAYIDKAAVVGRLVKQISVTNLASDNFVGPAIIAVDGIADMPEEIFGPVLHVAKYRAQELEQTIHDLNDSGFGLTFGLHTRIDSRVEHLVNNLNVGNLYVNRDQVGAVVGSQPFGGEGLSGTGPKAGGPSYLSRFMSNELPKRKQIEPANFSIVTLEQAQKALDALIHQRTKLGEQELPGPTGESNRLYEYGRGVVLCLGSDIDSANEQAAIALRNGCVPLIICPDARGENALDGFLPRELLIDLSGISLTVLWGRTSDVRATRQALAARSGAIIPLVWDMRLAEACRLERHVCVNTVAAGGNAALLNSAISVK